MLFVFVYNSEPHKRVSDFAVEEDIEQLEEEGSLEFTDFIKPEKPKLKK